MKIKKTKNILTALSLLALAGAACADDAMTATGWYGGLDLGQSRATIDDQRIANSLAMQGFTQTQISKDTRDLAFKAFAGYQFSRYFALESGVFDLGTFSFAAQTQPAGTLYGQAKFQGVNLDALGIAPLTDRFSAFARAGVHYAKAQAAFRGMGAVQVADPRRSETAANYKIGVGLEYALTHQLGLRAELERYRVKDAVGNRGDIDVASLGVVYRFKTASPVSILAASTPMPEAVVETAPLSPSIRKTLVLNANSQFDFDQARIKPEGKQALDQFAVDVKSSHYEKISVTGYTDRLGSSDHNDDLSARRAEAVKNYLVDSASIPASKIEASGAGESTPVTKPGQCEQQTSGKASIALIACLQPDRRVEVESTVKK